MTTPAKPLRVLFTGSREWRDWPLAEQVLCNLARDHPEGITVVVGDCPRGLDHITRQLCRKLRIPFEEHEARWYDPCIPKCRPDHRRPGKDGKTFCPAQGNYRNTRMARSGIGLCCAFFKQRAANSGTTHCVGAARDAGLTDDQIWRYRR